MSRFRPGVHAAWEVDEMEPHIAWIFPLGHGHAAQFQNLRDSCPPDINDRSTWVGMDFFQSEDWLANTPLLPAQLRRARHEMWHFEHRLGSEIRPDDVLFVASWNLRFLPHMHRHPSYFYVDFSPSCMRSLSPWYDHFYRKSALAQVGRELLASTLPRSARAVFAMSQWCADGIVRDYGIAPERVHVVPGGANLDHWHFVERSNHSDPVRVLMVGGEFKRKGGELLLEWAERMAPRNVEIDIVTWPGQLPERVRELLGDPSTFQKVSKSLAPWLPHVRVHCGLKPNTRELLSLFEQADIFCLPTQGDFSSIASLEAMATGLPVVVGAVGGIPELIEHGKTGFLVEPGNLEKLNEALAPLVYERTLRLEVGRAGRRACETRFNTKRQLADIVRLIDEDLASDDRRSRVSVLLSRIAKALPSSPPPRPH
jgi:glycosyltransferase involved in cell wall biosynthesis